jgi:hypothetical protein
VNVPSGSALVLVKVQVDPAQLAVKLADGGVVSEGGVTPLPLPPQAVATATMMVVPIAEGIDRTQPV